MRAMYSEAIPAGHLQLPEPLYALMAVGAGGAIVLPKVYPTLDKAMAAWQTGGYKVGEVAVVRLDSTLPKE